MRDADLHTIAAPEAHGRPEQDGLDVSAQQNLDEQIIRNLPIGIGIYDADGSCVIANELLAHQIGATLEQVKAQNFHEIESWKKSGLYDLALRTLRTGEATSAIVHLRTTFGRDIWPAVRFGVLRSGAGTFLMHTVEDRTDFKRAESEHQALLDAYRMLFESSMDGVLLTRADGSLVAANPAACAMLGLPEHEIRRRGRSGVMDESDARLAKSLEERARAGRVLAELTMVRGNGEKFQVELASALYRDREGNPLANVVFRDITERRRIESERNSREARYRAVVETSPDGFWAVDLQGRLVEVNDAYVRLSGYSREELLTMAVPDLDAKDTPEEIAARVEKIIRDGHDRFETLHRRKDGALWPVEIVVAYAPLEGGRFFVFTRDLTTARQAEDYMRVACLIYESSAEAVMLTDENNNIVDINPAFVQQTGYTLREIRGRNPRILESGRHDAKFYEDMWRAIVEKDHWQGELWDRRKDGSLHVKFASIRVIRDSDGRVFRHVAQFFDITEQKQKEELIWRQANYDPLTELPNRRLFQERLEHETRKTNRSGLPLALLFIDLDRFKEINDVLGHAKGDVLLTQAARRISGCVRDTDMVARLGGDEFTVILSDIRERSTLERITQNIIRALSEPFDLGSGGDPSYVSASVGITFYPDDGHTIEELLKHADQAMYAAKAQGRGRFSYFTSAMQREGQERLALTNDLRNALARGELEVYYQPIVDARSGRIARAEALLRWKHPTRGMVSPVTFIPLAEESGLILEIGDWVFDQAIACVERWHQRAGRPIQVSVNVSPSQLHHEANATWMEKLARSGAPASSIAVEITEGILMKDSPEVRRRLLQYRRSGVEVSIDDFGTGFSSLSYIQQFHIDYLKIDRTFVNQMTQRESDATLAEAIIVMAHKLGIKTIAEGVETAAQRDLLISFGCDYLQGYLYSRPVPAEAFEQLLLHPAYAA